MSKIFEDFPQVNCNQCSRYYDNSCDGVKKDTKKPCNSFIATRSVIIPEQIKSLRKHIKWLYFGLISYMVLFILHMIFQALGWV